MYTKTLWEIKGLFSSIEGYIKTKRLRETLSTIASPLGYLFTLDLYLVINNKN